MGANVNSKNKLGDSVLHSACSIGDLSTVQMLVESGGNVNSANADKETPLHWASASGHPVLVRYLIQNKADASARSGKGKTARELASDVQTIAAF